MKSEEEVPKTSLSVLGEGILGLEPHSIPPDAGCPFLHSGSEAPLSILLATLEASPTSFLGPLWDLLRLWPVPGPLQGHFSWPGTWAALSLQGSL